MSDNVHTLTRPDQMAAYMRSQLDPVRLGDAALMVRLRDLIAEAQNRPSIRTELLTMLGDSICELRLPEVIALGCFSFVPADSPSGSRPAGTEDVSRGPAAGSAEQSRRDREAP